MRRFALGATASELDTYMADGLRGAVDRLLDYQTVDEGFGLDPDFFRRPNGVLSSSACAVWWTLRLLMTRRPLQERMALFWHGHFATSASKVEPARLMVQQNETIRSNATASFRKLLMSVSKDPAMIVWLDTEQNIKGHPNENFARECLELFTLGLGHFTESDVQESARAFTGWTIQREPGDGATDPTADFVFRPARHDPGTKTVLGVTANMDGDNVLDVLCDNPLTAEFLVTKVWDRFVWPKPDPDTVAPFVRLFRDSGLDIKALLRSIMLSDQFYSERARRAIVKSPVDVCVTTLRQLGVGDRIRDRLAAPQPGSPPFLVAGPAFAATQAMRRMGMWLFYPPDVHGWDGGTAWITTQTMVERIKWGERLFGEPQARGPSPGVSAFPLLQADPTPDGVVRQLVALFDLDTTPAHTKILRDEAARVSGGRLMADNADATASAVCRLIFAAPEAQFS